MWQSWTVLQQVCFCVAALFSLILIVQIILMLIGGADGDADLDVDLDGDGIPDLDVDGGFSLFTIKGLIAFFAVGGWMGFAFGGGFIHAGWAILIAVVSGAVAFVGVGLLLYWISKLAMNGTLDIKNAVGKTAEVYLTIPASCKAAGKITVLVQGRLVELDAMTESDEPIKTGAKVTIVRTDSSTCYVEAVKVA